MIGKLDRHAVVCGAVQDVPDSLASFVRGDLYGPRRSGAGRRKDGLWCRKTAQIGVLDIRTNAIETPQKIVGRIKKAVAVVPPDRLTLSTDCGMKPLARMVAKMKLKALADAAKIVRNEVMGVR